jgi:hypothetical protein
MWSDFFVFCQESVTAQERYGKYEDEDKHAEQSKLNHAGPEDARPGGGPRSFFGECGSFQGDYENAPYGGDQADDVTEMAAGLMVFRKTKLKSEIPASQPKELIQMGRI